MPSPAYAAAPTGPLLGLHPGQTALVVAPHPDDETLGPGGTLHRLSTSGVTVMVLAIACYNCPMWGGHSDTDIRAKEFDTACDALGVEGRVIAWTDDDHAHTPGNHPADLVAVIEYRTEVSLVHTRPDLLLIPAATALHQDHRAVHHAGLAAARLGGTCKPAPPIVLGYRGPEDHWAPGGEPWTVGVDTTANWPAKHQALLAHASQLREPPHPRSIHAVHALDTAAGAAIGTSLAERFVPYRMAC